MQYDQALKVLEEADCLADRATVEAAIDRMADAITASIGKKKTDGLLRHERRPDLLRPAADQTFISP